MGRRHDRAINLQLASKVRGMRQSRKVSCERLALDADIEPRFLRYFETGARGISVETAGRLAVALGMSLSELFEGVKVEATPN